MGRIFRYMMQGMVMLLVAALSCLPAGTALAQVAEMVCFLPWGDNAGEIGLLNQPEVEKCGPLAFCVDGTGIFFLDSVHQQVVGVDKGGNVKVIAQKSGGWAICGDGAGGVFVQEADRILSLNTQGKKMAYTLKNKSGKAPRLIEGYGNELIVNSNGVLCVRAVTQEVYPVSDAPRIKRPAAIKSAPPLHYIIKRMLKNEVRILGLDDNDKALVSIPVQIDDGQAGRRCSKERTSRAMSMQRWSLSRMVASNCRFTAIRRAAVASPYSACRTTTSPQFTKRRRFQRTGSFIRCSPCRTASGFSATERSDAHEKK